MFLHIVVAKFKEATSEKQITDIVAGLQTLPAKIADIRRFEVGLDVLHSGRSYDFGLVSSFEDQAAFERYRAHPDHLPLAQTLAALSQSMIAVDMEV
jgi:hypothetical protein